MKIDIITKEDLKKIEEKFLKLEKMLDDLKIKLKQKEQETNRVSIKKDLMKFKKEFDENNNVMLEINNLKDNFKDFSKSFQNKFNEMVDKFNSHIKEGLMTK